MTRFCALLALIAFGLVGCASEPQKPLPDINLGTIQASYDGVRYSAYPNGDKPVAGCTSITTDSFTEGAVGDGAGEGCKAGAGDYDLVVSGSAQPANGYLASKDAGAGDVQIEGRITDSYTGTSQNFANVGVELRESTASTSWLIRCHSLNAGATALQVQYGSNGSYTTVNGANGEARPRYCAITYDVSSGDLKAFGSSDGSTWAEIASTNRAMSDVLCAIVGTSRDTGETLSATIDNFACGSTIDAYTPSDPDPGAPTLVSDIGAQSCTQNSSCSVDCNANWSGATSYSFSGLPTGISQGSASSCAISGTPTGTGTSNITVTATNAGGDTVDAFALTVSAATGDVFTIASSNTQQTYNCGSTTAATGVTWTSLRTSGTGTRPGPGDTLVLAAGTRNGKLKLTNCVGSDSSRITIRNDTSAGGPVIFRDNNGSGGGFFFECSDCENVDVTGLGKWSGAPSGTCGISKTLAFPTESETTCGIQFETDGNDPMFTSWIKLSGTSTKMSFRGISIDRTGGTGAGGIGFQIHDQAVTNGYSGTGAYSGLWREDITIEQNFLTGPGGTSGEGMYVGSNAINDDLPLRNIEIAYNLLVDIARECINGKYWLGGVNSVHHNVVRRCGIASTSGQNRGINITDGGDNLSIYSNIVEDAGGEGILWINNNAKVSGAGKEPPDSDESDNAPGPFTGRIYNNIIFDPGAKQASTGYGVKVASAGDATEIVYNPIIYNNTVVRAVAGSAVICTGTSTSRVARNNILAGTVTSVSGCTDTNNQKGTVVQQAFAAAGSDNYELTSGSPACNSASNPDGLTTDYEDGTRPLGGTNDQGADESASCP